MKQVYTVGTDRQIKEIFLDGGESKKDIGIAFNQIAMPSTNKLLFAGINDPGKSPGSIRCFKFPLTGNFNEY